MAEGKLLTSGSSLFLKSRFGVGYHLTMVKGRDASSERICEVVTSTIDGAEKVEDVAGELSFVLPSHLTDQYPELFDKLEADKEALGITSYGVAATSIEDVFLRIMKAVDEGHFDAELLKPPPKKKTLRRQLTRMLSRRSQADEDRSTEGGVNALGVEMATITFGEPDVPGTEKPGIQDPNQPEVKNGSQNGTEKRNPIENQDGNQNGSRNGHQDEAKDRDQKTRGNKDTASTDDIDYLNDIDLNTGGRLWIQQFWAMLVKRALNTMRNAGNVLSQFILPPLVFLGALIYIKTLPDPNAQDTAITLTHPLTSSVSNIVMEYGDFRASPTDDVFSTLDASLLQLSSFRNITEGVNIIRQEVLTHNNSALCCDYNQQLLDNYCLSINSSVYLNDLSSCSSNANFAFANCLNCLRESSSCGLTSPTPTTPPLTGPVSDINTYITEYMLRNVPFVEFVQNHQLAVVHDDLPLPVGSLFTVWYNSRYLHKAPAALSTFHNLYLNHLLQANSIQGQTTVNFINQPLPRIENGIADRVNADFIGFVLGFFLALPGVFLLGGFILSPVEESSSKSKHLQFVSGVRVSSYWMANFVWDITIILVNIVIICVMVAAFQIGEFTGANFLAFFLLLVLVCWVGLPLMYCLSFLFKSSLLAFSASVMVLYFLAVGLVAVKNAVANVDSTTADIIHYISLTIPSYSFGAGIQTIYSNENRRQICPINPASCDSSIRFTDNIFELNSLGVGLNLIVLAAEGVLMWILTIFVINSFFCKEGRWLKLRTQQRNVMKHRRRNAIRRQRTFRKREDDDVERERSRVDDMRYLEDTEKDPLTIADLSKWYEKFLHKLGLRKFLSKQKRAVNHLSVGVHKSECFGLLGVNGAGKTTTFKILTGDLNPTSGTAFIAGDDIRKNTKGAQQHLGYCPQFDALLERMTGEELLTMFCRLRGIPEKKIPHVVKTEIKRLDLEKYAKKRCGTYSGGNKRKLSTAIALVGSPPIILLDEPTTGMDPNARRHLWNALTELVAVGKSIVLTSHSMEECEALCTRLAIMVNGEFKSLGSAQHLKNKFGSGYTLSIKAMRSPLGPDGTTVYRTNVPTLGDLGPSLSLCSFTLSRIDERVFNSVFPGATVLEEHDGYATINLPSNGLSWSEIFRKLEEHKEYLGIEDYSVSQTTLEQVFLDVAKHQHVIPEDQPA
jgi:ATP-binding cassette subfamily A (ABC1) protein 3